MAGRARRRDAAREPDRRAAWFMLARMSERVQFTSGGLKLAGLVDLPADYKRGERRAAFLVLHGFGSRKGSDGMRIAAELYASLGYVAVRFDFRGCGESEGTRGRGICLEQVPDARPALQFLMDLPEVDAQRIGVYGHSFGAPVAVYAAGVEARFAACVSSGGWGDGVKKFRRQHASPDAWAKFEA